MDATLKSGVHPMFVIETDYELALMEAELSWIDRLVADIEEGPFAERSGERTIWSVKFEENDE
ncbi:hypothetical protein ACF3MZ_17170 [Paenibacillaceae bacterium WGS1546]|uniref:hypothetical protein n=1 Tax=Cohnella sp. WGS1546 TaxID=3366810 RepID=UPI00372D5DDC